MQRITSLASLVTRAEALSAALRAWLSVTQYMQNSNDMRMVFPVGVTPFNSATRWIMYVYTYFIPDIYVILDCAPQPRTHRLARSTGVLSHAHSLPCPSPLPLAPRRAGPVELYEVFKVVACTRTIRHGCVHMLRVDVWISRSASSSVRLQGRVCVLARR
eukprot:5418184-Pleurochrysis_carterae.AAC.2